MRRLQASKSISPSGHHLQVKFRPHLDIVLPPDRSAEKLSLFTEYVGDYPEATGPIVLLNSGGMYRFTHNQQVDFHVAFGLNHNSPSYTLGVGYSFRVDTLFAAK